MTAGLKIILVAAGVKKKVAKDAKNQFLQSLREKVME